MPLGRATGAAAVVSPDNTGAGVKRVARHAAGTPTRPRVLRRRRSAAGRQRRQAPEPGDCPRPPAPVPIVRPSSRSSSLMLALIASAVSWTAAFSG